MKILDIKNWIPEVRDVASELFTVDNAVVIDQLVSGLDQDLTGIAAKMDENDALAKSIAEMQISNDSALASLLAAAIAAKRAGIYPYYLSTAIALVLLDSAEAPCDAQSGPVDTCNATDIDLTSIIDESLFTHFQLKNEPELRHLIRRQIAAIKEKGLVLPKPDDYAKIKQAYELGFLYEGVYRGCAQCVLASLFDVTGNANPAVFRTASSMGGGSALCGDGSCGAYNGSIMEIGMYVGRRLENITGDQAEKDKSVAMCQVVHDNFIHTYGSVICRNIHESIFNRAYVLRNPEDRAAFPDAGAYTEKCNTVVGIASAWTMEQLILNDFA